MQVQTATTFDLPQAHFTPENNTAPSNLTSYAVFESFIVHDGDKIDVTNIFTTSCFERWLLSRRGSIQHPRRSFQRALYAHIRGADGRKPFPEEIESEILYVLRNWSKDGKQNPWDNVFGSGQNDLNVGLKGFKSLGYHEQKRIVKKTGEPIKKRTRKKNSSKEYLKPEHPVVPRKIIKSEQKEARIPYEELQLTKFSTGQSPWNTFVSVMNSYLEPNLQKSFLKAALRRGVPLTSFSVVYLLNTPPSPDDLRFNWNFLMPPFEERYFDENLPIGNLMYSSEWVCVGENSQALEMFGESSIGQHVLEKNKSIVHSLYCNIRFIPEFYGNGEAWCRLIMNKSEGSGVFLLKCVRRSNGQIFCQMQDQSMYYEDLLIAPFFI